MGYFGHFLGLGSILVIFWSILVILGFWGYFGHFRGLGGRGGILLSLEVLEVFFSFCGFWRYFDHFLGSEGILVIFRF